MGKYLDFPLGIAAILVKGAIVGAAVGAVGYTGCVGFSDGGFGNWDCRTLHLENAWAWELWQVNSATAGIGSHFGGVGSGFGGTSGLSGVGLELTRATVHGMSNMIVNGAFGNNLSAGTFAIGAGGSLMGSGLHGAPGAVQIAGSAAFNSGGIAEATGGIDFWRGAATGATVSGFKSFGTLLGLKGLNLIEL